MTFLADTHTVDGQEISALQEAIEGHVGNTQFAALLLNEIASNAMNIQNQTNVNTVGKPACYDDMKACPDMTSLNTFITSMTDHDKSGCLLYALYEPADNTIFINALSGSINKLSADDMKTLMTLSAVDKLDSDNVQAMLQTKTVLANKLSIILEA
jgi:hypothetical protein